MITPAVSAEREVIGAIEDKTADEVEFDLDCEALLAIGLDEEDEVGNVVIVVVTVVLMTTAVNEFGSAVKNVERNEKEHSPDDTMFASWYATVILLITKWAVMPPVLSTDTGMKSVDSASVMFASLSASSRRNKASSAGVGSSAPKSAGKENDTNIGAGPVLYEMEG